MNANKKQFKIEPPSPCRKCSGKGLKANHWNVDCPLRDDKKEKGFTGKEEDSSSEEEPSSRYKRLERAYLAFQTARGEESDEDNSQGHDEIIANFGVACRECKEPFSSGNQLHSHLKSFNAHAVSGNPIIIDLTAQPKGECVEGIANSTETRVKAYLTADSSSTSLFTAVVDSGFGRSAVNRKLLLNVPHTLKPIHRLIIRGIGGRQAVTEMAMFTFYLRSAQGAFLKLRIAALVFDDLGTDLLISTDYIRAWNIVLDIPHQLAVFHRSGKAGKPLATVCLHVTRQPSTSIVVRAAKNSIIPAGSLGQVPIRLNHTGRSDLLFTSAKDEIPDGVVSAAQETIGYLNHSSAPLTVTRGTILGTASTIANGNFAYSPQATYALNRFLGFTPQNQEETAGGAATELSANSAAVEPGTNSADTADDLRWLEKTYQPQYRCELPKGVVVPDISTSTYREVRVNDKLPLEQQKQLRQLAKRFAVLFNDSPGLARQPESEWLRIKVPPELERGLKPRAPYRNAPRAKQAIDETFNENIRLGRMGPAKHSPYSLPVFVVYKYTPEGAVKKARPVIDLRPLNSIAESDAYPLPLQEDILAALAYAD